MTALTFSHIGITVPDLESGGVLLQGFWPLRANGTHRNTARRKCHRSDV